MNNLNARRRYFIYSPLEKGDRGGCSAEAERQNYKQPPPPPLLRGNFPVNSHLFQFLTKFVDKTYPLERSSHETQRRRAGVDFLSLLSKFCLLLSMLIFITGCESIPFQKTPDEPYSAVDPALVKERFRSSIPQQMRLLNTIVFDYNWRTFSGIGFVDVNIPERTCSLACINQMGMKLFEISIDKENINTIFALPDFTSKGDFAKMVGEDIRRIYFDLVPSDNADIIREKHAVIFNQKDGEGITEYIFSGPGQYLTEKTYYEDGNPLWRVSFYEYQSRNGMIYPGGTIFNNLKYGYRLIIRLKEISD